MPQEAQGQPDLALTETQNWASRSHRELYDAVHNDNDPGRVGQLADEWKRLSQEVTEAGERMAERLRATEAGWQGDAADAARSAIRKLSDWNGEAGKTAGEVSERIANQGRIMETAKTEMPEPVENPKLATVAAAAFASRDVWKMAKASEDIKVHNERTSTAHQQAVDVMTRMETESRGVDNDTPRFTPPPAPFRDPEGEKPGKPGSTKPSSAPADAPPAGNSPAGNSPAGSSPASAPTAPGAPPAPNQSASAPVQPASAPPVQPASAPPVPPIAAPTQKIDTRALGGPGATGPASAKGGGPDAPTRQFRPPKLKDTTSQDPPTRAFKAPDLKPTTGPSSTNPQSVSDTSTGGLHKREDQQYQPPRPFQTPDGMPFRGPGGNNRGPDNRGPNNRGGPGNGWGGQIPPIPGSGGTGGAAFTGGSGGAGGAGGGAGGAGGSGPNLSPGGSSGTGGTGGGQGTVRNMGAVPPGQSGASGGAMGPMGMGGMGARGQGGEDDKERKSKYVEGGPIVEVPGADAVPPVIGERKRKKKEEG